jgi:hypothetical protein
MGDPLDELLAFGRSYQRELETKPPGEVIHPSPEALLKYLTIANIALVEFKERGRIGRPRGSGMGGDAASLIDGGLHEDDALRVVSERYRKPLAIVRDALRRHRNRQKSFSFLSSS